MKSKSIRVVLLAILVAVMSLATKAQAADLYVSSSSSATIHRFGADGSDLGTVASAPSLIFPAGIAFNSSGNLFVASLAGIIQQFGPTGTDLGMFGGVLFGTPFNLAFNSSGNLFVANLFSNTIHEFGPNGADLGTFASTPGTTGNYGIAFDSSGNLFVSSQASNTANTIHEFGPNGADLGTFASFGTTKFPVFTGNLAFNSSGNLFVSLSDSTVHQFGPTGADLGTFVSTAGTPDNPSGLAFDANDNLYVGYTNFGLNNTIHKFGPTGVDLGTFASTGQNVPDFLAFAPVPEPSTFALATFGLIGLAACGWRRKR
jgi:sugar lactone lactonase YvrE